jgi:AbrB family looped-hinge helix DNA binding protein
MRITAKGQVTIPQDIREKAGLMPNTEVEFNYDGRAVTIKPARSKTRPGRGERLVERLSGSATVKMTTDQILKLMRDA